MLAVASCNVWGVDLPFRIASLAVEERVPIVAQVLARHADLDNNDAVNVDVVCFQEVFSARIYEWLAGESSPLRRQLQHVKWFHGGNLIVSRFPFIEDEFYPYTVAGRPDRFYQGDFYVYKGVARARISVPDPALGKNVFFDIMCSHLHAQYGSERYLGTRLAQTAEIAEVTLSMRKQAADNDHHFVIVAGDLNSEPVELPFRLLLDVAGLVDTHEENEDSPGATSNTTHWSETDDPPERIDYVLADPSLSITNTSLLLTERHEALQDRHASDHFGVLSVVSWKSNFPATDMNEETNHMKSTTVLEVRETFLREAEQFRRVELRALLHAAMLIPAAVFLSKIPRTTLYSSAILRLIRFAASSGMFVLGALKLWTVWAAFQSRKHSQQMAKEWPRP